MTHERSTERSTPPGAPSPRSERREPRASSLRLALAVAAVAALAWLPSLRGGFVWDDQHDILRSDKLHRLGAVVDVFRHHAMWSAEQPETEIATYRPLALATLAVDWRLWHLRPAGYHAVNVQLHIFAMLALFVALSTLIERRAAALLVILCAIHPADAEAVAWINGRSEMLALGFGALAIAAAATSRWLALTALLLLAMLAKETGALFVPIAVAVAWLRGSRRWQSILAMGAAAAVATLAYVALRAGALGRVALPPHAGATAAALLPVVGRTTAAALWPTRASPIELSTWLQALSPAGRLGWSLAGAVPVVATMALALRRRWLPAIGLAWWLLAVAPTASIAALDYPWPGLGRWLYVGLPGLGLAIYCAIAQFHGAHAQFRGADAQFRPARLALVAAVSAVAALFVAGDQRGIAVWRSDEALYGAMVRDSPGDAWAWRALGTAHLAVARYADAAADFHRAVTVDRTAEIHAAYALEAYAWTFLGRCHDAVAQFRAHPPTPALPTETFDAAAATCVENPQRR